MSSFIGSLNLRRFGNGVPIVSDPYRPITVINGLIAFSRGLLIQTNAPSAPQIYKYTIIQSIMRSEMCSLHLTHPSTHTWMHTLGWVVGSGQLVDFTAGAGIRTHNHGLPRVSSPTLYPLGHSVALLSSVAAFSLHMEYRRCQPPCSRFIASDVPHSKCEGFRHLKMSIL